MFRKPYRVKTNTQLKTSERKKLGARLQTAGFLPPDDGADGEFAQLNQWWATKADWSCQQIECHDGTCIGVYVRAQCPLLLEFKHNKSLLPSLYFAHNAPACYRTLVVPAQVFSFILNGADLMLPGVVRELCPTDLTKNQVCAISLLEGGVVSGPVAVGLCEMDYKQMVACGWKGKAVTIIHHINDYLWNSGPKTALPSTPLNTAVTEEVNSQLNDLQLEDEEAAQAIGAENSSNNDEASAQCSRSDGEEDKAEEMSPETLLLRCFLAAIKYRLPRDKLPFDVGTFYSQCLLKCVPPDMRIDLKKTPYKKFSVFLKAMADDQPGLIEIKNIAPGVDQIVAVDFGHAAVRQFEPDRERVKDEPAADGGAQFNPPVLEDFYAVTQPSLAVLHGVRKGDHITMKQLRELVTDYVRKNDLQSEKVVRLDETLVKLVGTKTHSLNDRLNWAQLLDCVAGKLTKCYRATSADGCVEYKTGNRPKVILGVEKRMGNKKVSTIKNASAFGISGPELAGRVQRAAAASASVQQDLVVVQGNQIAHIGQILQDVYKIERRFITGLELAPKPKNK